MSDFKLNKKEIIDLLPHREPMLLIDELSNIKKLFSATAIVNVRKDSFFVQGHFPGNPVMPGVLIVEALAQATGLLGMESHPEETTENSLYLFVGIDKCRFKRPVEPGDQLILKVELIGGKRGIYKFKAEATVDGKVAATAEIMCTSREL